MLHIDFGRTISRTGQNKSASVAEESKLIFLRPCRSMQEVAFAPTAPKHHGCWHRGAVKEKPLVHKCTNWCYACTSCHQQQRPVQALLHKAGRVTVRTQNLDADHFALGHVLYPTRKQASPRASKGSRPVGQCGREGDLRWCIHPSTCSRKQSCSKPWRCMEQPRQCRPHGWKVFAEDFHDRAALAVAIFSPCGMSLPCCKILESFFFMVGCCKLRHCLEKSSLRSRAANIKGTLEPHFQRCCELYSRWQFACTSSEMFWIELHCGQAGAADPKSIQQLAYIHAHGFRVDSHTIAGPVHRQSLVRCFASWRFVKRLVACTCTSSIQNKSPTTKNESIAA
eukprot:scaffold31_cov334-Pavlova_lutheri.AAC.12